MFNSRKAFFEQKLEEALSRAIEIEQEIKKHPARKEALVARLDITMKVAEMFEQRIAEVK